MPAPAKAQRLPATPPASAKVIRISAGALLLEERKTLQAMQQDIRTVGKSAVADATRFDDDDRKPDDKRAALLALLLAVGAQMSSALQRSIQDRRQAVRIRATQRLGVEIGAALGASVTLSTQAHKRLAEDAMYAKNAASSIAAQWQASAAAQAMEALRNEGSPYRAIGKATDDIESRAGRAAATETVQAYNDEHRRRAYEWVDEDAPGTEFADVTMLVRRWDAILDRRTCPTCAGHDGELTTIAGSFDSGDEPGFVHVFCRCLSTIVRVPVQ